MDRVMCSAIISHRQRMKRKGQSTWKGTCQRAATAVIISKMVGTAVLGTRQRVSVKDPVCTVHGHRAEAAGDEVRWPSRGDVMAP